MSVLNNSDALVSAAEHRRCAAKKNIKTKAPVGKTNQGRIKKCRYPDRHFPVAVKNIEFLTATFTVFSCF